jgi:hypothetical protein
LTDQINTFFIIYGWKSRGDDDDDNDNDDDIAQFNVGAQPLVTTIRGTVKMDTMSQFFQNLQT